MAGSEPTKSEDRRRCPVCGRPAEPRWRPFCSKRCANVDLGRWLGERYVIPSVDDPVNDDDGET